MNRQTVNRREVAFLCLALPALVNAQGLSDIVNAVKDPLISMLTSKLGITDGQAKGGMGSLLALAKEKMPAANFSKLTSVLPTATGYMDTAKEMGALAAPLKNMSGLNGALSKLGMNSTAVKQFVPTATDYIGKIGGDALKNMLLGALK